MIPITTKAGLRHYDRRLTAIIISKTPTQIRKKVRGLRDNGKLPRPNDLFSSDSSEIEEEDPDPVVLPPDMPPIAVFEAQLADQEWEVSPTTAWLATEQCGLLEDNLTNIIQNVEVISQGTVNEFIVRFTTAITASGAQL